MLKRKDSMVVRGDGDKLEVTPLGAGNEVGRSCVYTTYKGKTVMVLPQRSCRVFRRFHLSKQPPEIFCEVLFLACQDTCSWHLDKSAYFGALEALALTQSKC